MVSIWGEFIFNNNEVLSKNLEVVSALEAAASIGGILISEPVHTNTLVTIKNKEQI